MNEHIKRHLKKFIPISAAKFDERCWGIETILHNMIQEQEELSKKIAQFMEKIIAGQSDEKSICDRNRQKLYELSQMIQLIQNNQEQICVDFTACRNANIHQEILESLQMLSYKSGRLEEELQNIRTGDLFRRIEYIQWKLGNLEYLIQSNLLRDDEQQKSSDYQFILRMRALFPLMSIDHQKGFSRIGKDFDGGYVMLDDFEHRKIAYSFGIADDVSWDLDIARRGIDVYMYDHTINALPEHNERFHFSPIGLCAGNVQAERLKSLSDLIRENGHSTEYGMILKCDIEGAEWDVLCDIEEDELKHFSQIVFEFHSLISREQEDKITKSMLKLNKTHQLVHIHANNHGRYLSLGGIVMPDLLECTYLLREEYQFKKHSGIVREKFDQANNEYIPDIFLGAWDISSDQPGNVSKPADSKEQE